MSLFHRKKSHTIQDALAPRKEFLERGKAEFLAAFDARYGNLAKARHAGGFSLAMRITGVALAVVGITAGASVYADTANVSATNPLYPLKRLSENIQLAVTPAPQKAQLEADFAARRAHELSSVESKNPSSTLTVFLKRDLNHSIDASLNEADKTDLQNGSLRAFCGSYVSLSSSSSLAIENVLLTNPSLLARFEMRCGAVMSTPSSSLETTTESTSTAPSWNHGKGEWRVNTDNENHGGNMMNESSSVSATMHASGTVILMPHDSNNSDTSGVFGGTTTSNAKGDNFETSHDGEDGFLRKILPQAPIPPMMLDSTTTVSATSEMDGML